jgi:hypothetical protein
VNYIEAIEHTLKSAYDEYKKSKGLLDVEHDSISIKLWRCLKLVEILKQEEKDDM